MAASIDSASTWVFKMFPQVNSVCGDDIKVLPNAILGVADTHKLTRTHVYKYTHNRTPHT